MPRKLKGKMKTKAVARAIAKAGVSGNIYGNITIRTQQRANPGLVARGPPPTPPVIPIPYPQPQPVLTPQGIMNPTAFQTLEQAINKLSTGLTLTSNLNNPQIQSVAPSVSRSAQVELPDKDTNDGVGSQEMMNVVNRLGLIPGGMPLGAGRVRTQASLTARSMATEMPMMGGFSETRRERQPSIASGSSTASVSIGDGVRLSIKEIQDTGVQAESPTRGTRPPPDVSEENTRRVLAYEGSGLTQREIARRLGLSESSVSRKLSKEKAKSKK